MPSCSGQFQDVYRGLVTPSGQNIHQPLLAPLAVDESRKSKDDAVFLLLALLSDLITLRRSLGSETNIINSTAPAIARVNHFPLFSAHTEYSRIQSDIELGLDRWHSIFGSSVGPDVLSLYQFCRLVVACPVLPLIHKAAVCQDVDYSRNAVLHRLPANTEILDVAVNYAWSVLDSAAACPTSLDKRPSTWGSSSTTPPQPPPEQQYLCSAWMPTVVFQSALLIWAKIVRGRRGSRDTQGNISIRALVAFQVELQTMQWPCCTSMVATLQRLMSTERR